MSKQRSRIRWTRRALNRRERIMVTCLSLIVAAYGAAHLLETAYLEPTRALERAVTSAEEQVRHQRTLLSRADQIHARYRKLESPAVAGADSARSENEVLRELSELAGTQVHVKSVVPRLGHHEGKSVLFVALDCEGPFVAVVGYLERILAEMPSEIGNLSLAPQPGAENSIVCRLSIRVGGLGTSTGT